MIQVKTPVDGGWQIFQKPSPTVYTEHCHGTFMAHDIWESQFWCPGASFTSLVPGGAGALARLWEVPLILTKREQQLFQAVSLPL